MNVLGIAIGRKAHDHWPVVATYSRPDSAPVVTAGQLTLDEEALRAQTRPTAYGRMLGEALFRDAVRDAFVRALPAGQGERLDVLLELGDDALRASVRWEWLCAPTDESWPFLALNSQTPYARYIPRAMGAFFRPIARRDLSALVVVVSPSDVADFHLKPFDVAAAVGRVQTALGDIPTRVLADVQAVPSAVGLPTLDALIDQVTRQPTQLLHIVCHGAVGKTGETYLFLNARNGRVDSVSATALIDRLRLAQGAYGLPHLVFLSACETASMEGEQALGGMGQRLVRELGFPAVIAMTERVSVATALRLSEGFYQKLRIHGNPAHALADAGAALASQPDALVPALFTCAPGQSIFTDDRPLNAQDVLFGIGKLEQMLPERAPVLLLDELEPDGLGNFSRLARSARQTLSAGDSADSATQPVSLPILADLDALARDALEMPFAALALGKSPPTYDVSLPFMGMNAFQSSDHRFYFGRRKLVRALATLAESPGLIGVFGPSGCGKSSLVLAGVIPELQAGQPDPQAVTVRPGRSPLSQLEQALSAPTPTPALLVVDQFEELFTLVDDEAARQAFVERLLQLAGSLPVILTMRSEFLDDCARYPAFYAALQARLQHIAPMTSDELSTAIQAQASAVNLVFEADLVNTILDDVAGEPGAMPLLQHGLLRLWQRRHGRRLAAGEYRKIGGIQQAIAQTAEGVYLRLPAEDQALMRRILLRLVRLDDDDLRRDARQREQFDQLLVDENERQAVGRLVARLADEKLLSTSVNPASGQHEVELAHEALIQHWERLREWIEADRADLKLHQKLFAAAANWVELDRDAGPLYRGASLAQADEHYRRQPGAFNLLEREFVLASIAERDREHEEAERQRRVELELANERAERAEQAAAAQARRVRRLRVAVVVLAVLLIAPALLVMREVQQRLSPWKPVSGFPKDPVSSVALNHTNDPTAPWICAGTADVGLGCTRDGKRWNIYQQDLPTGRPAGNAGPLFTGAQGIVALAIDPTRPNRLFVSVYHGKTENGDDAGGTMRSDDGGRTFHAANGGLPSEPAIQLAVFGDAVFASYGPDQGYKLFASRDGGESWDLTGGGGKSPMSEVYAVRVTPHGAVVMAGAKEGLFIARLDGATLEWHNTLPGEPVVVIESGSQDSEQYYLATWNAGTRVGELLDWHLESEPETLARLTEQPMAVAVGSNRSPTRAVYLLLSNGDVLVVEKGNVRTIRHYPAWSVESLLLPPAADLAITENISGNLTLWQGNIDGLFTYSQDEH